MRPDDLRASDFCEIGNHNACETYYCACECHAVRSPSTEPAPETCPWSVYPNGSFRCVLERGHNGLHQVMFGDLEKAEPAPTPESEAPRPNEVVVPFTPRPYVRSVPVSVPPGEAERLAYWLEGVAYQGTIEMPSVGQAKCDRAAALLRSQASKIAELSRQLEEARSHAHMSGERDMEARRNVVTLRAQLFASDEARKSEVAALRTQLEEARTQTERLQRHLQWAKNPHHANCRCSTLSDTGNCSCGLSGFLEVSG